MWLRRPLALAFILYVVLDLACPMIPGAFTFDPADSVDAVSAYRLRPGTLPRIVSAPPSSPVERPAVSPRCHADIRPVGRLSGDWQPHICQDPAAPSDPRPSLDDD